MRTLIKNANIYDTVKRTFRRASILFGERILEVGDVCEAADRVIDAEDRYLIPGLIDMHTHGRAGHDFSSADADALGVMKRSFASAGVTTVVPTFASSPLDEWYRAIERINKVRSDEGARLTGLHIEGRYLNPEKRGIHRPELLHAPDVSELKELFSRAGLPLHLTYAPELDADGSFTSCAVSLGVTLGIGHSAADYGTARRAEELGATSYTHTFNAMPPLHHRDGGCVAAALTGDRFCELICDGKHIAPQMIDLAYRLATDDRIILVSDSMEGAGAPDGVYKVAGETVTVKDGYALSSDGTLGGSTLDLFTALANFTSFTRQKIEDTVICATRNPAIEMGIYGDVGSLDAGKYADILMIELINGKPELCSVFMG